MSAEVDADHGGRIQSLVDRISGRELLYQREVPSGPWLEYLPGCPGGWDDMFPNDAPWRGHPDHGRLWSAACSVESAAGDGMRLQTTLDSPAVTISRNYRLLPAPRRGLRVETTLSARADTGPFLWSSHPMLQVAEGWLILVGPSEIEVDEELPGRFDGGAKLTAGTRADALRVPAPGEGWAEVLYAEGGGSAEVGPPGGDVRTRLSWDTDFFPNVWIVTVTGELDIDLCLVLEPCTTRPYRLDDAIATGNAMSMSAGAERVFWVELESLDG